MPFKKLGIFTTALLAMALNGCANRGDNPEWRPYKDMDGSIQHMSFRGLERAVTVDGKSRKVQVVEADRAVVRGDVKTRVPLGELQGLQTAGQGTIGVLLVQNGKALDVYQADNIKALAQGKTFEFYEFGNFRLNHALFRAKNGICQDFNSKQGVNLLMTTNYYPQNSFTDFYTALIDVNIQRNQTPKEIGYTPSFTGNNAVLQAELKDHEAKQGKALAVANIKEKASILFNIICKQ